MPGREFIKVCYSPLLVVGLLAFFLCCCGRTPKLGRDPVKKVVAAMTLEEKAYFVTGTGMQISGQEMQKEVRAPGAPVIGQTQNLPRQLASFDPDNSSWIAEAGKYEVKAGASSRDIRQSASFTLDNDLIVKKESSALHPKTTINELKRVSAK